MSIRVVLTLTGDQHAHLRSFLFPPDGKEAVAIMLCGRRDGDRRHRLLIREIHGIPYDSASARAWASLGGRIISRRFSSAPLRSGCRS